MTKSAVTDFFLKYFEKQRINIAWISENTGIAMDKLSENYSEPLKAEEFLDLCVLLGIKPEEVWREIKKKSNE